MDVRDVQNLNDVLKNDSDDFIFPVVEWSEIEKAIEQEEAAIEDYDTFADFWHDHADRTKSAVRETLKKFFENKKKQK